MNLYSVKYSCKFQMAIINLNFWLIQALSPNWFVIK